MIRNSAPYCFILQRKELENYLLQPEAISKAMSRRLEERGGPLRELNVDHVCGLLEDVTSALEKEVSVQCYAHRLRYFGKSGPDQSTILHDSLQWFESQW